MKKNQGFSLIETMVVLAILSILSLVGIESIIEFQKNALLDTSANEFASALRRAQSMSITGEIPNVSCPNNPCSDNLNIASNFDTDGLPTYRVNLSSVNYTIWYDYQLETQPVPHQCCLETFPIDSKISIASTPAVTNIAFARLTGLTTPPITFEVIRLDNNRKIQVIINDKGAILTNPL